MEVGNWGDISLDQLDSHGSSIIKYIGAKLVACKLVKKSFVTNFDIVCGEDHPVLFGLSTLRYLGLFAEYLLVLDKACVHNKEECPSNKVKATGGAHDWGQVSLNTCHSSIPRGFTRTGKATGSAQDWGHALLNTCHLSLPRRFEGTGKANGGTQGWGYALLNTCHSSLPGGHAKSIDAQVVPRKSGQ